MKPYALSPRIARQPRTTSTPTPHLDPPHSLTLGAGSRTSLMCVRTSVQSASDQPWSAPLVKALAAAQKMSVPAAMAVLVAREGLLHVPLSHSPRESCVRFTPFARVRRLWMVGRLRDDGVEPACGLSGVSGCESLGDEVSAPPPPPSHPASEAGGQWFCCGPQQRNERGL